MSTTDFVAADVVCHRRCYAEFMVKKSVKNFLVRPKNTRNLKFIEKIYALTEEKVEECQFSLSGVLQNVEG